MLPLISNGEHETLESDAVTGVGGEVATVARTPTVRARDAIASAESSGFDALQSMPIDDLLDRVADAGRRFEGIGPTDSGEDALSPLDEYRLDVARATGLPVGWVDVSTHWLGYALRHAAESLRAQSPTGGLGVYDDPAYTRETTVGLAFAPRVRSLGWVMPANDPAVYGWPALALAMKIPIVIRPSGREPFTAIRLARSLLAADVPPEAIHVLPGPWSVGEVVAREAGHGMVYGAASTTRPHRDDPAIETYGPGRSVAVVGTDPTDRQLDTLARGVTRAGGRACFNLSRIVTLDGCDADALADALARRVVDASAGSITDEETDVPVFPDDERDVDSERARDIDGRADDAGRDVTATHRDGARLRTTDEGVRLAPTVVRNSDLVPELPFPFVGVTAASELDVDGDDPRALVEACEGAYLGVAVNAPDVEWAMVRTAGVRKVYGGTYPAAVDLRETHETFLTDVCYDVTTYDPS